MKELSIEEKAKAYDEALERAEKALEVLGTDKCEGARQILSLFPELRESEDERIREQIIYAINKLNVPESEKSKLLAWLEKQGEQEYVERPKFKVGDLIRNKWSNHSKEIVAVDDCQYTLNDGMPAPPFKVAIKEQDNWELVEQKPTWSEEDEVMIKVFDSIIRYIVEVVDKDVLERFGTNREELFSWLKSLKQRIGG